MKLLLSEDTPNLGRQREFDYAKLISIVFMVIIHVWEDLSFFDCYGEVPTGFWHNLLQFGAGPLAAPVFMFAMGIGMCYSSHRSPAEFAKRGINLFLMGYVLDICRNGIYYVIYYATHGDWDWEEIIYECFNGDILQFAGLTFLLVALLKKCKVPVLAMGGIAVVMQGVGYWLSDMFEISGNWSYVVGNIFYVENCCFPIMQWFIYPVAGIIFAKYLRHITNKDKMYGSLLGISAVLLAGFCSALYFAGYDIKQFYILTEDVYYKQEFFHSFFTILVIITEISLLYFLTKNIKSKAITSLVSYISNKLNTIYIIQWMLVGTADFIIIMADLDAFNTRVSLIHGFIFIILAVSISKLYYMIKGNAKKQKQ